MRLQARGGRGRRRRGCGRVMINVQAAIGRRNETKRRRSEAARRKRVEAIQVNKWFET